MTGVDVNVVNPWNEWDPLKEAVVGSARGAADIGYEPSLSPYFPPGSAGRAFRTARSSGGGGRCGANSTILLTCLIGVESQCAGERLESPTLGTPAPSIP